MFGNGSCWRRLAPAAAAAEVGEAVRSSAPVSVAEAASGLGLLPPMSA